MDLLLANKFARILTMSGAKATIEEAAAALKKFVAVMDPLVEKKKISNKIEKAYVELITNVAIGN